MLAREKRWDSDISSGSDSDDAHVAVPPPVSQPARTTAWFPPPPPMPMSTQRQMPPTTAQVQHKRVQIVEQRQPVHAMPVLPELIVSPAPPLTPEARSPMTPMTPVEHLVHSRKGLGRGKSKRKTIMEFIDGWWDLGLLEQQKRAASRRK
ncbi:hypothetical protein BDP81DRAFT_400845 [Colletotrichum phormii]|uniref:Uncharacterized protein n=1 Tax=Colletotrichum phormii TaxID=359342 RepID=A0AAJ0E7K3_9PEZI|nr:uncharacterized protein BDP81DRAFT_400845 [Colletotrichum phormii]KAK1621824.1 hypothetical protein BDP81DRAFT_400845 [Colletotrichum phormii]